MEIPYDQLYRINMIHVLEDIQQQYMMELQPHVKHNMKKLLNNSINSSRLFIKEVDNRLSPDTQIQFGDIADKIREFLDYNFYGKG